MNIVDIEKKLNELTTKVHTILQISSTLIAQAMRHQQREKEFDKEKEVMQIRLKEREEQATKQEKEIGQLQSLVKTLQDQRLDVLKESDKEISAHSQIMKLKYELEVMTSRAKNLERELGGSKLELEQLRTTNQQLRRIQKLH